MKLITSSILLLVLLSFTSCKQVNEQEVAPSSESLELSNPPIPTQEIRFESGGVQLVGTLFKPDNPKAAIVLVHGSDSVPRMLGFGRQLAQHGLLVFTYDKRGVGASGGVYAGPEVGTNNISVENLELLAQDASAAVNLIQQESPNLEIGLLGFSQAGWIIPKTAKKNSAVDFMVLFSCPTITTLEQLRFQFYTNGQTDFWEHHTDAEARDHIENDPDRYQFIATDPKKTLQELTIPGLWIFGEKDIQIPVQLCSEQLDTLKAKGKAYEYILFPSLGHNTAFTFSTEPVDQAIQWIKGKVDSSSNEQENP